MNSIQCVKEVKKLHCKIASYQYRMAKNQNNNWHKILKEPCQQFIPNKNAYLNVNKDDIHTIQTHALTKGLNGF